MSDVKWIKLSTDIFDNRKIRQIEKMPDGDSIIVIWLKLLILAGNVNDGGLVYFTKDIPYTDQLLATQFDRPLATVQLAVNTFERFGMIEIIDNLICVSNWEKYQNVESLERIREQTRKRVAKHREQKKQALLQSENICVYCGEHGDTIDHVIPKSKGGLDIHENVVPCCLSCNMEKTNRDVSEFLNSRLALGEPVDIQRIQSNEVLQRYTTFDYQQNRFVPCVTQNVTLRNATDIDKEEDIEEEEEKKVSSSRFKAPTVDEIKSYCSERKNDVDAQRFFDYYESNGWHVGKNKMKDWKAAVRTWERSNNRASRSDSSSTAKSTKQWNIHYD